MAGTPRYAAAPMNAVLIPVRALAGAKRRLAPDVAHHARERLALAMLEDMIDAALRAGSVERVVVVSTDSELLARAAAAGADPLRETEPKGLNAAVRWAAARLESEGVARLLTIPGDVPLLDPNEIDIAFATDPKLFPVVLIPSGSGTGTNGLLTSPPSALVPHFEGESLEAHRRAAADAGLGFHVLGLPSFALDVDTAADLDALVETGDRVRRSARVGAELRAYAATGSAGGKGGESRAKIDELVEILTRFSD
jgi:2-phospho-L-lactate guanylyltransferase